MYNLKKCEIDAVQKGLIRRFGNALLQGTRLNIVNSSG